MTLIELVVFLFYQCIVIFLAVTGYNLFGWGGAYGFGILGCSAIFFISEWASTPSEKDREPGDKPKEAEDDHHVLLVLLFIQCIAIFLAVTGYNRSGWGDAYLFSTLGSFVILLGVLPLLMRFYDWLRGNPPDCKCGLPESVRKYETDANQNFVSICTCGRRYMRDGKKFMEVLPDGSVQPYLKRKNARWVDDGASEKVLVER